MEIIALILGIITGTLIEEYIRKRVTYKRLKLINRYQRITACDRVLIKHKGKWFEIVVDYFVNDPIYKCKMYINEELVLTGIELNHGKTNSRQMEYNHNRSEAEINKLLKLAYNKMKKKYYNQELKIDYSFKSFWED